MNPPVMDKRMLRLLVGLALENELYNDRENAQLRGLYSDPDLPEIQNYYRKLASSESSCDREAAFWLESALRQERPASVDASALIVRLQQVEAILYTLLMDTPFDVSRDLNDWLNYVANAGESLKGTYVLDAKILTSRAIESSERALAGVSMRNPRRRYELGLLKTETQKIFEELKMVHSTLQVPEELLDAHLKIQASLIGLLTLLKGTDAETQATQELRYSAQKLASAQRLLLRSQKEVSKAGQEIALAQEYIGMAIEKAVNSATKLRLIRILQQLRSLTVESKG